MSFPEGTTTAGPCGEDTPQMWYDMALAVDPNNPDALFLDAIDIWKSTDGGKTLTDISCGYHVGLNPVGSPVHVDQHALAYQPGSSTNLMAGSDGGIYVSNNAANAPQGTATGIVNPPTFKDVNLTMNTIEFYGGDISSNFATASNPFIVGGAQDNGSSYGQFGPRRDVSRHRLPVVAADRRRRLLRAHRAEAGTARLHGEPERQPPALDDRPAGPVPVRRRRLGRRPAVVHLPVQDRQVRVPDDDVRPHDRGVVPRVRVDRRRDELVRRTAPT